MGIYDREYYRREGPSYLGSFTERGHVCKWLIAVNVICFVLQLVMQGPATVIQLPDGREVEVRSSPFTDALVLNVKSVQEGQVWRLLTYAFLHDPHSLWHILFNMLLLWWFGSDVEDLYGPREFLLFYLLSAVAGGLAFTLAGLAELGGFQCLGASGAVTAVLVLCAVHFPTRVILISFFIPVPIWLFVIINVAEDAFVFLSQYTNTRTAVTVHLAGAAFAYLYYKRHWRLSTLWLYVTRWSYLRSLGSYLRAWPKQLFRPKLRVYREEPPQPVHAAAAPPPAPPADDVDEHLEARLDAILAKVTRSGRASLTESENKILLRASEIYKRRRT